MPFWPIPAQNISIGSRFKRRFSAFDFEGAHVDEGNRMPRNETSPWANVPPDILCYICDQAFSETSVHYGVEMLALVCKNWYQTVTGYGRPWSVIRIAPYSCKSTVYTTTKSYVNTRLKHSHHYPLHVIIHPVLPDQLGGPNFLQRDIRKSIDAIIGEGLHARRWESLDAMSHPYVLARLKYPTPILHRVVISGVGRYGWNLEGLFPVAPKLRVLSLRGSNGIYYLRLPASPSVTVDNLQLEGFNLYTCVSILERFSKTQQLTTLELIGTWSHEPHRGPITLPTVRSLTLNAQGPICVIFSAIILPSLVQLIVIGSQKADERKVMIDDNYAFTSIESKLETLHLESLHFYSEHDLESILVAAPKVKRLTMKDVTYEPYDDEDPMMLEDTTAKDPSWTLGRWITGWQAPGRSSEPEYMKLLKNPLVFPVLGRCIVDDIDREDLVLRRKREIG